MNDRIEKLIEAYLRVLNKAVENQKKPREYGTGEPLYPSEIHAIMLIGGHEGSHVSELARIAGVTKGAVSQVVGKLEMKGYVRKIEDPEKASRTLLELTNKGKLAYYAQKHMHEEMDAPLLKYLKSLGKDKIDAMIEMLGHFEKMAERLK